MVIEELICTKQDGTISLGNYTLGQKAEKPDLEYQGDVYKVKTYDEITKLERNDTSVYESAPGTAIEYFKATDEGVELIVEGSKGVQITVQLENDTDCKAYINDAAVGNMKTNMSGKLSVSVGLEEGLTVNTKVIRGV